MHQNGGGITVKIPLFKIATGEDDCKAVNKVIMRGSFWAEGPEIEQFEEKVAKYIGTRYGIAFNSGTSALHALLESYKLKYPLGFDDFEVIVPSFTFMSTATSVLLAGGRPVFSEIEYETYGLDVEDIENRITVKTKAIILVHYGGYPARDTIKIRQLADKNNLLLIEDAAESMGAKINGQMIGSIGDSAMLSFCQSKTLGIGEGGMIVTNSTTIRDKARLVRSHGKEGDDCVLPGYNYRMPTMCAALGLSQMKRIDDNIKKRRTAADYIRTHLKECPKLDFPSLIKDHFQVYQLFTIMFENSEIRDNVKKALDAAGVQSKIYFNPVHRTKLYYSTNYGNLPITSDIAGCVLTVPMYPDITKNDLDLIIDTIKETVN